MVENINFMIEFKNVSMTYPGADEQALTDVSFNIEAGEFVFIIGPSGSGKSTVIKLISREEKFQEGEIIVAEHELSKLKNRKIPFLRRNLGLVFQDFRLIESKTVFENVSFAMEILGKSKREIKRQVPIVLSTVGIRDKEDSYPNELSGGEQQRVGIARALVNNPDIILADEPTGNLDPEISQKIMSVFADINREGTTVLVCTHDKDLVDLMQERVIAIDDGQVVRDAAKSEYISVTV